MDEDDGVVNEHVEKVDRGLEDEASNSRGEADLFVCLEASPAGVYAR